VDLNKIRELTFEYCGEWTLNHADRLLKLIEIIGEDRRYDHQLVWIAVHLHDWGAYEPFAEEGKDHAVRSREVAAEILQQMDLSIEDQRIVLDAIGEHGGAGECSSIESKLLREADYLDFLGIIGIARDFARGPKNLQKCVAAVKKRMKLFSQLTLPKAIEIGKERLAEMNHFLERMESESFGLY
jgi:uncharacterized protein